MATQTDAGLAPAAAALANANRLLERAPHLAEQQARAILEVLPGHPEAELLIGAARRRVGDTPAARDILAKLATAQPRSARTRFELALTYAALGETGAAITALRAAVTLAPATGEAWRTLGDLLTLEGDTTGADAAYGRHIRAAINDPHLMQAADALCSGRLDVAERLLKTRLKQSPTDIAAIRMLGETATRLGRNRDAENLLARCLELAPGFTAARHNYAVVLYRSGKVAEAIPHINQLLALDPRDPGYRNLLAACLAGVADYGRAIEIYETVLREFPRQPKIWMSYGHALRTAGRRADSIRAYRTSIAQEPSLGEAYWSLANLKTAPFDAADITAMRAQLAGADLAEDDRLHLHYALGRALEDEAAWEESFLHYAEGARLRRAQVRYSADETSTQVRRAIEFYTPLVLAPRAPARRNEAAPIFIIGLPRSGSTLIEQILASHSMVEGTMELPEIANIARELSKEGTVSYPDCLAAMDEPALAALGERFIERTLVYRKTNRPIFIDKMPNNWAHTGLIRLILPNAKIIDARRHPMAACFSSFKQHFARGQHFSYDLTELGRYYTDYVAMMAHFDEALPGLVHRVHYENMVFDTEAEIRHLLAYCGLPFDERCLRFWETERAVRTASSEQVRQPIFREGMDHWRNYEPWLSELRNALGGLPSATGALPLDPIGA